MKTQTRPFRRAYWFAPIVACIVLAATHSARSVDERPVLLFLGTSLTAGYGLPSDEAFPALIQARLDERGLAYRVVNAGVSGDTSAGGLRRIGWLMQNPVDTLVLELGGNDMLRGLDPDRMHGNLQRIIDQARENRPGTGIVIAGMRAAPNLGNAYRERFESVYPKLAKDNEAVLIPFLLEGVAGSPKLNQVDGIHPNAQGHRIIAEHVWNHLEALVAPGPR